MNGCARLVCFNEESAPVLLEQGRTTTTAIDFTVCIDYRHSGRSGGHRMHWSPALPGVYWKNCIFPKDNSSQRNLRDTFTGKGCHGLGKVRTPPNRLRVIGPWYLRTLADSKPSCCPFAKRYQISFRETEVEQSSSKFFVLLKFVIGRLFWKVTAHFQRTLAFTRLYFRFTWPSPFSGCTEYLGRRTASATTRS